MSTRKPKLVQVFSVVLIACTAVESALTRSKIKLQNNEYSGIVIAINEDIPEDVAIVNNLQEIFTNASRILHRATKKRAFFKDITILLPETWGDSLTSESATSETFDTANIIVDKPNSVWGDNPYANQLGSCGEEAEYIHLTANFLADKDWAWKTFGDPARVLVHEWGHYRWGLFDEYSTSDDNHFYLNDKGHVAVTKCSSHVAGNALDVRNGKECNKNPEAGILPDKYCRYYPDLQKNQATGSMMYMSFMETVVDFCHTDLNDDPLSFHNVMAPNPQNIHCKYKSAWEVMLDSGDFKSGANSPRDVTDTTPTFKILKSAPKRIVLVLDTSGSMETNDRIGKLNQLATKYIRATVPDGSSVGIVQFSDVATIRSYLRELTSDSDREALANLLPTTVLGPTCIGCALLRGVEVLEYGGKSARGGIILLISDGEENRTPDIASVKDEMISKEVIIDTVAFSNAADEKLLGLSQDTGGLSFFYSEAADSTGLNDALTATITERGGGSSSTPIQLQSTRGTISNGSGSGKIGGVTVIDATIGRETKFFFLWESSQVSVKINRPNGGTIDSTSPEYTVDSDNNMIIADIDGIAEPGEWSYEVSGPDQPVEISIQSKSRDNIQPIRVTSKVGEVSMTNSQPKVNIYAQVNRGYTPVLKATVTAIVERPTPHFPVFVDLLDNGAGVDVSKDDGVYSGLFLDFVTSTCPNCRYNVKVKAEDPYNKAEVPVTSAWGIRSKALPIVPPGPVEETNTTNNTESTGQFNREVSGGVIQVPVTIGTNDVFPPSRITDLRVTQTSYEDKTITLQWTAPGEDFDVGTAQEYDLRYSVNFTTFVQDFLEGVPLTDDNVTAGNNLTSPGQFGSVETATILLSDVISDVTYFFGVRALDDSGNEGEPSNIVSARFLPIPTVLPTTLPSTTTVIASATLQTTDESVVKVTVGVPTRRGVPSLVVVISIVLAVATVVAFAVVMVLLKVKFKSPSAVAVEEGVANGKTQKGNAWRELRFQATPNNKVEPVKNA
ncbi:calcium-activated chloride channel regulator 1-like [Ptychodera flava]|uniref:calcium-activated chloride channel regulator 1-like n=1 Tax=Ptychodera flava TaxID=63121 RepID=UPI003969FC71